MTKLARLGHAHNHTPQATSNSMVPHDKTKETMTFIELEERDCACARMNKLTKLEGNTKATNATEISLLSERCT